MRSILTLTLLSASAVFAQTPSFEVAVIKPTSLVQIQERIHANQPAHVGVSIDKSRVDLGFQSLSALIVRAYGVSELQIAGPASLETEHFDILAKMPEGATEEQVPAMLRALLTSRFGMKMHRENKESPVYALVVSKSGVKMKPGDTAEVLPEPRDGDRTLATPFGKMTMRMNGDQGVMMFGAGVGIMKSSMGPNGIHMEMSNLTMPRLVALLMETSDRMVIDKTGLTGSWQASTDIPMDAMRESAGAEAGTAGVAAAPVTVNPMLKSVEQLGLKLEPQKAPVETIVIDSIEKIPTEN